MSAAAKSAPAHLILIGLPGAGKSTHGRRAAKQMQRPFIDLDRRIAKIAGRSVASIFAQDGEKVFRALEQEATAALASEPASIVAPGGGWVMNPDNVALVKPDSTIVWLQVSPQVAVGACATGSGSGRCFGRAILSARSRNCSGGARLGTRWRIFQSTRNSLTGMEL